MENKEIGFILKRFLPYKQKLSVLHETKGKIGLITNPIKISQKLWPGMLIEFYSIQNNNKITIANNTEIIHSHTSISADNLHWLHNLLELCYYSLPPECPAKEIFDFLGNCTTILKKPTFSNKKFEIIKKIILLRMLALLGFYPSDSFFSSFEQSNLLSSIFVDFSSKQKVESLKIDIKNINKFVNEDVDKWLFSSLKSHPLCRAFKTIYFPS